MVGKDVTENKTKRKKQTNKQTNKQTKAVLWGDREKYGSIWRVHDPHIFKM